MLAALALLVGRELIILVLAYAVVAKAKDDFDAVVFLLALLAYRRLSLLIVERGKAHTDKVGRIGLEHSVGYHTGDRRNLVCCRSIPPDSLKTPPFRTVLLQAAGDTHFVLIILD